MRKIIIIISILLIFPYFVFLQSCATNPGRYKTEESAEARLMQLTEAEIAIKLGAPTERVITSDGGEVWTYRDKAESLTGGECTVSVVIKNGRVITASVTAKDRSWLSYPLGSCKNIPGNFE